MITLNKIQAIDKVKEILSRSGDEEIAEYLNHLSPGEYQIEGISLSKAFDLYCRHNEAKYPEIRDLRQQGHWFKVIGVENSHPKSQFHVGDVVLISIGYVTNVTNGWTFDTIPDRKHGSSGHCWSQWGEGWLVWGQGVIVKPVDGGYVRVD